MPPHWSVLIVLLLAGCVGAGCAGGRAASPDDYLARIPTLQEQAAADPDDAGALLALGEAYAQAGDFALAYEILRAAERLGPDDSDTYYYLGLVEEGLGDPAEALARYEDAPRSSSHWRRMEERAVWLRREIARADVLATLNAEEYPHAEEIQEAVAVFPFSYEGDSRYRPLARALRELLAADLDATGDVRVVEGARVLALTDELELEPVDIDTARARRLARVLWSSHALVGALTVRDGTVQIEASLVGPAGGAEPVVVEGPLSDLFRLEGELAAELYGALGAPPPEAWRERLGRAPTESLRAFLLYGQGLIEEDAGRYPAAAALYAEAGDLDPGFLAAGERLDDVATRAYLPAGLDVALAELGALRHELDAHALVSGRLTALSRSLGAHLVPGEGAREPSAEVAPAPPELDPFSTPPPPPETGGN